jgi:Ca2+-transporting ATPase
MAQRKAVVRRLSAIETLGSTTVICTDKTGTLTRNEMTVTELALADGRFFRVTGVGYAPDGFLTTLEGTAVEANHDAPLNEFLKALVLCNDAHLGAPKHAQSPWTALGDPTEVALLTLAHKAGVIPDDIRTQFPRRAEIPFDSASKVMATQHDVAGASVVFLKGAPEVMAGLAHKPSPLLQKAAEDMASRALRVLAVGAYEGTLDLPAGVRGTSGKVRLLGLVGQIDPPRAEVEAAIAPCASAPGLGAALLASSSCTSFQLRNSHWQG